MNATKTRAHGLTVIGNGCQEGHDFLLDPDVFKLVLPAEGKVVCTRCGLTGTVLGATLTRAQFGSNHHPIYIITIKED